METIFFNVGTLIEFNNDGDLCKIVGSFSIRKKYKIIYQSLRTGKKYSDLRIDLIQWEKDGILKIKN